MRYALAIIIILGVTAPSFSGAQQPDAEALYQKGAGSYFASRTDQAEADLSRAIEAAPQDPRGYYLRGLNRLAAGDTTAAQDDLSMGANLEAQLGSASPLVDRSLSAVQGSSRLMLERIRRAARESAKVEAQRSFVLERKKAREEREQRVLRTKYQLPIESLASRLSVAQARNVAQKERPGTESMVAVGGAGTLASDNPFADDPRNQAGNISAEDIAATTDRGDPRPTVDVNVPEAARGSMKASKLLSIFGGLGVKATSRVSETVGGLAPPGFGIGGPPTGFGGSEDGGDFGPGDFGADEGGLPSGGDTGAGQGSFGDFGEFSDGNQDDEASPFDFGE